jgi:hypothetical protein
MSNSGSGMSFIFIYFGTLILYVTPFVKYIVMFRICKVVQPASRKCRQTVSGEAGNKGV